MQPWHPQRYEQIAGGCRNGVGLDRSFFAQTLVDAVADEHEATADAGRLTELDHGSASYLFAEASDAHHDRTIFAIGVSHEPPDPRDTSYQRNFPLPEDIGGRPTDRGHFIPHTVGGLFGPNIFQQDRYLNRGWSREGREYRALERLAAAGNTMFVHPTYTDGSDVPAFLAVGVLIGDDLLVRVFRNRYDEPSLGPDADRLSVALAGATDAQIGDLGEETAMEHLVAACDATVITMGDSHMPRENSRQDLDLVVEVDGLLVALEVKSRSRGRQAGTLTRNGNLSSPRMRRPTQLGRGRQASQSYVLARLEDVIDTSEVSAIDVRIVVVDFVAMLIQQFDVGDDGRRLSARGEPADCGEAARRALRNIEAHRGHL